MQFSRPKAKESLDLDFSKWLQIHDEKQHRDANLVMKSKKMADLAKVGTPMWAHFNLGNPYEEFQKDKALLMEKQRFEQLAGGRRGRTETPPGSAGAGEREREAVVVQAGGRQIVGNFDHLNSLQPLAALRRSHHPSHNPVPLPLGPLSQKPMSPPSSPHEARRQQMEAAILARSSSWAAGSSPSRNAQKQQPTWPPQVSMTQEPAQKLDRSESGFRVTLNYQPPEEERQVSEREHRLGFRGCRWGSTTMRLG
eukprot:gb/GFBE01055540.1/.p1 GENE.gb/GFBE01055540.1/~~gb/GFBE01055540.1/.p1  ORF type:complete len:253 (+),score=51.88 gb/GFBE01055540.1/:1-759(+)